MSYAPSSPIPEHPPAELLAQLDNAVHVLDTLSARSAELVLGMDRRERSLQIELHEGEETRRLTPTQLLDLLTGN